MLHLCILVIMVSEYQLLTTKYFFQQKLYSGWVRRTVCQTVTQYHGSTTIAVFLTVDCKEYSLSLLGQLVSWSRLIILHLSLFVIAWKACWLAWKNKKYKGKYRNTFLEYISTYVLNTCAACICRGPHIFVVYRNSFRTKWFNKSESLWTWVH